MITFFRIGYGPIENVWYNQRCIYQGKLDFSFATKYQMQTLSLSSTDESGSIARSSIELLSVLTQNYVDPKVFLMLCDNFL